MRRLLIISSVVLFTIFIALTIFSIGYLIESKNSNSNEVFSNGKPAKFRVVAILPSNNGKLEILIRNSLNKSFIDKDISLQIYDLEQHSTSEKEALLIERAYLTKPEAIILYPQNNKEIESIINSGIDRGIKIITIVRDVPGSRRNAFIGTNNFEIGQKTGKLILKLRPTGAKIGIILPENNQNLNSENSVLLNTINQIISKDKRYKITDIRYSNSGTPEGQELANKMLLANSDIDTIISTNPDDIIGVTQTLYELNKVKNITLIGYDTNAEIDELKKKGIISALILRNPEKIGEVCQEMIQDLQSTGTIPSYFDLGIEVVE